ncbi:hypothetical protein ACRQ5Q_21615 [Bradyrhizobium sp. PMVTL-01]|uniref:hypothetical protein n=1 Tax=Bradyrhizobium sp. PMVTL-01 TaxID=3434999 RepID=UPI003F704761
MTADIVEFPMRRHEDRLVLAVIRLEEIVREVERIAVEQPADGLHCLLAVMERLGDGLVDSSSLLLDDDANGRIQSAFTSLSIKIAETREALVELGKRTHP